MDTAKEYPPDFGVQVAAKLLAKHCNCIARFRYGHNMLSVVCLSVTRRHECIVTKQLQIGSRGFHCEVPK